ncbi:MAG TPA: transporter substrate-binding domain-containing protein [Vicinamibacterales bacterium]|nr:transporter substrate-binding domain-containing protein [Vicinamibacterales bacterium]
MRRFLGRPRRGGYRPAFGLFLLSIAAASLIVSAQTDQLRLVSTAWPPFTNEPGRPRFALDLVEAALHRIGLRTSTTIVEAARFTSSLLNDFDGSGAVWRDDERERVLLFSQPYLENRLILVGRTGADVSAAALGDLKGKRIAIVEGYSYGEAVDRAGPTFVRSRSEEDSLALLLGGSVDYTLMDDLVVQYIVDNYAKEAQTRLALGSKPLVTRPLYFAVRRTRPDAQAIINRFNAQLRGMIADRTYHQLLHVSWIEADIDSDGRAEYVPYSDRAGPQEPQRAYALFSTTQPKPQSGDGERRFYLGGTIYTDWATVPQTYKGYDSQHPDPARSTGSIFTFRW